MLKKYHISEITAPAGSRESFAAALHAGADAVYLGAPGFNMRAGAEAFTSADIRDMILEARRRGVKLYLAVNTIVFDGELDEAARLLDFAAESGIDAVILWDMGILALARERGLRIHLSTQASVSNFRAAQFYESLGVNRIVLARELSLEQIRETITGTRARGSALEFECFVHGAMCVAVSGRCLTSQFLSGRSANRGDCLQPCRRSYRVIDERNGNELVLDGHSVLSARDICAVDILDRLIDAGIDAFKIEGRMRDALYVKTTVECYREARDAVLSETFSPELAKRLRERLGRVFTRGFSRGFYLDHPDREIVRSEGNIASVVKEYAGRVLNFYPKARAADILLEARAISRGEIILITGPTTGAIECRADSLRSEENRPIEHAPQGSVAAVAVTERVREGDRVYVLAPRA
ncbi:MAG: peptidase U32 family protein [Candidatus Latescibacterota bacterium]